MVSREEEISSFQRFAIQGALVFPYRGLSQAGPAMGMQGEWGWDQKVPKMQDKITALKPTLGSWSDPGGRGTLEAKQGSVSSTLPSSSISGVSSTQGTCYPRIGSVQ